MLAKIILVLLLLGMMGFLFRGLFTLVKDEEGSKRTVKALMWRVGLAVLLIVFLIVSFQQGWIKPHGIGG